MSTSQTVSTHNDDSFVPPQPSLREDVNARSYEMKPDAGPCLAIIFDTMSNSNTRATSDMKLLKDFLQQSWNFKVVQVKVAHKDWQEDKAGFLKHWLARVFTERAIMPQDDNYVFVGFFYENNLQLNSEPLWDGMVTDDSFMFTRPKILLFQEYKYTDVSHCQTDCSPGRNLLQNDGARVFVNPKVHQPSHLDIFSIHGFGNDYVKTFTEVASQDPEMELSDLLTKVHKKMLSINPETHPYYISTLQRHLKMTNISANIDQVDNASNNTADLISRQVDEAKTRVMWETQYKSLQQRVIKLCEKLQNSKLELTWKPYTDTYVRVMNDVEVALKHVLMRRAHQKHEDRNNWLQPEYQRITREIEDLEKKLST